MKNTGNGLEGLEFTTFQEYIIKNVCRYYYELDPVMKNRPNVYPWYTNELKKPSKHDTEVSAILLSSDEDLDTSDDSVTSDNVGAVDTRTNYEYELSSTSPKVTTLTNVSSPMSVTLSDTNDSMSLISPSTASGTMSSSGDTDTTLGTKDGSSNRKKLTPVQAKKKQRRYIQEKKSLVKKRGKGHNNSNPLTVDKKSRSLIVETRNEKMDFERKKHDDLRTIEAEKLKLEKERLQMDRDSAAMKQVHITAQTRLENNKIVLLRLEIFKERQRIKKENKDVTKEYLDHNFPYPN